MPAPKEVTWPKDPHTRAKHVILEEYLKAWYPIMLQINPRLVVLDGFAGPGLYDGGELGSPLIAIDTLLNHSRVSVPFDSVLFMFIEQSKPRLDHLESLLQLRYAGRKLAIQTYLGDFNEHMTSVLDQLDKNDQRLAPTFAFLDPFGFSNTPMETIARLMSHPRCEVLINFMYGFVHRFLATPDPIIQRHYDRLFGTREWRTIANANLPPEERETRIISLYQDQLKRKGGAHFVRSFCMVNQYNQTEYYLVFGTRHARGLDRMKAAMRKADSTGGYTFSDRTDPNQLVMFGEPDYPLLAQQVSEHFSRQTVSLAAVEEFVIVDTGFLSSDMRAHALKPLEQSGKLVVSGVPDSRKRFTYPEKQANTMLLTFR